MPDAHANRPAGDIDACWLREYLISTGNANLCQLMKEQEDPVSWLESRAAPAFWRRINDAWKQHCSEPETRRSRYVTRKISAHSTTWILVDAMLTDAGERRPQAAEAGAIDMDSLLLQMSRKWLGRARAEEILRAAARDEDPRP